MKYKGFTLIELLIVVFVLLAGGGWIANIWKIISHIADPISLLIILRCVGTVFFPLGCVLGYF